MDARGFQLHRGCCSSLPQICREKDQFSHKLDCKRLTKQRKDKKKTKKNKKHRAIGARHVLQTRCSHRKKNVQDKFGSRDFEVWIL